MIELLKLINFKKIIFADLIFDQRTVEGAIDDLSKHLQKNIKSDSPFILFTAYNHIKTIIAYYAILNAGKIAVVIDPGIKYLEWNDIIKDTNPAAIITIDKVNVSFNYQKEIEFRKSDKGFIVRSNLKDVCTLAYTNAEDGYAKGAMLTVKNLLSEVYPMMETNQLTPESTICALLPFSHMYGLIQGILVPTHSGGSSVITELELLKLPEIIKKSKEYNVTHLYSVPSVYYILSKVGGIEKDTSMIKNFYSGGIQLTPFVTEAFYRVTKRSIRDGYGLTESSACAAYNYQEEGPIEGSFGKPMPGCEIKIVDKENNECGANEIGEICIKGDIIFKGYFNDEQTTNLKLQNDWLYSGDLGKKDGQGFFYFEKVKKSMINVAGNKVYPRQLERFIKMHANVQEVNVYGESSFLQGELVCVDISLHNNSRKDQEILKTWCTKNINQTILPKKWEF
jgi:long-chain acyl-CoA synthetase